MNIKPSAIDRQDSVIFAAQMVGLGRKISWQKSTLSNPQYLVTYKGMKIKILKIVKTTSFVPELADGRLGPESLELTIDTTSFYGDDYSRLCHDIVHYKKDNYRIVDAKFQSAYSHSRDFLPMFTAFLIE